MDGEKRIQEKREENQTEVLGRGLEDIEGHIGGQGARIRRKRREKREKEDVEGGWGEPVLFGVRVGREMGVSGRVWVKG